MYHQLYFLPPLSCFHAHLLALSHIQIHAHTHTHTINANRESETDRQTHTHRHTHTHQAVHWPHWADESCTPRPHCPSLPPSPSLCPPSLAGRVTRQSHGSDCSFVGWGDWPGKHKSLLLIQLFNPILKHISSTHRLQPEDVTKTFVITYSNCSIPF